MAPGPPNLGTNRFASLVELPTKKRKPNKSLATELFPSLPTAQSADPKYVIVSAINSEKPLAHYSCFAVHKSLKIISKDILTVSELRDGNLLLLVKDANIASKFILSKNLPGICQISAKFHDNLNSTKGTVFAPFLNYVSESEIVNELKNCGVVDVYKFQKVIDGKTQPSGVVLLTFDRYNLPQSIDIAWRKVDVRQYIPNPMRCKSCQLLGHTAKYCKRSPSCVKCNLPPHTPTECSRISCANCLGEHPSSFPKCPKFQQSKEILKIKINKKCSLRDAIKTYKQLNPLPVQSFTSYSTAAAQAVSPNPPTSSNSPKSSNSHLSLNLPPKPNNLSSITHSTPNDKFANNTSISDPDFASTSKNNHIIINSNSQYNSPTANLSNITLANENIFTPLPSFSKVLSASLNSLHSSEDDMIS